MSIFLTAKSIFQLGRWSKEVKSDVLGGRSSDKEGQSKELHGEAEVDTGLISTPLLPFIPRDKQRFIRVFSLSFKLGTYSTSCPKYSYAKYFSAFFVFYWESVKDSFLH